MNNQELQQNVEKGLNEIKPFLISDGGDISLISIENNIVTVKLLGACTDCNVNKMTLKNGVEAMIKKHAPQITQVVAID